MKPDPFDAMAERLLARLETADAARRGFATEKTPEDLHAQVMAVAAFLREESQSTPKGFSEVAGPAVSRRLDSGSPIPRR